MHSAQLKKRRNSPALWTRHRDTIVKLYRDELQPLPDIVKTMAEQYDFKASEPAFKQQLSRWKVKRVGEQRVTENNEAKGPSRTPFRDCLRDGTRSNLTPAQDSVFGPSPNFASPALQHTALADREFGALLEQSFMDAELARVEPATRSSPVTISSDVSDDSRHTTPLDIGTSSRRSSVSAQQSITASSHFWMLHKRKSWKSDEWNILEAHLGLALFVLGFGHPKTVPFAREYCLRALEQSKPTIFDLKTLFDTYMDTDAYETEVKQSVETPEFLPEDARVAHLLYSQRAISSQSFRAYVRSIGLCRRPPEQRTWEIFCANAGAYDSRVKEQPPTSWTCKDEVYTHFFATIIELATNTLSDAFFSTGDAPWYMMRMLSYLLETPWPKPWLNVKLNFRQLFEYLWVNLQNYSRRRASNGSTEQCALLELKLLRGRDLWGSWDTILRLFYVLDDHFHLFTKEATISNRTSHLPEEWFSTLCVTICNYNKPFLNGKLKNLFWVWNAWPEEFDFYPAHDRCTEFWVSHGMIERYRVIAGTFTRTGQHPDNSTMESLGATRAALKTFLDLTI